MNIQKYCGKIEVFSLVLKDQMNINSLTVQNSKYYVLFYSNLLNIIVILQYNIVIIKNY